MEKDALDEWNEEELQADYWTAPHVGCVSVAKDGVAVMHLSMPFQTACGIKYERGVFAFESSNLIDCKDCRKLLDSSK